MLIPASGKRAPTGHCDSVSRLLRGVVDSYVRELGSHGCGRVMLSFLVVRFVKLQCVLLSESGAETLFFRSSC
jgi:hypothetical protein